MRQELEASAHDWRCSFLTLTYATPSLPAGRTLVKRHFQDFIANLRVGIADRLSPDDASWASITPAMQAGFSYGRFRHYGCGEYGEQSGRPHYHANIFGLSPSSQIGGRSFAELVEAKWSFGSVKVLPMIQGAAYYVASYLCQGLNRKGAPELGRRAPEFQLMSNGGGRSGFGGIGALAVPGLAAAAQVDPRGDVLREVQLAGGRPGSLDGYMLDRLRRAVGMSEAQVSELKLDNLRELVADSRDARFTALCPDDLPAEVIALRRAEFRRYWSALAAE